MNNVKEELVNHWVALSEKSVQPPKSESDRLIKLALTQQTPGLSFDRQVVREFFDHMTHVESSFTFFYVDEEQKKVNKMTLTKQPDGTTDWEGIEYDPIASARLLANYYWYVNGLRVAVRPGVKYGIRHN